MVCDKICRECRQIAPARQLYLGRRSRRMCLQEIFYSLRIQIHRSWGRRNELELWKLGLCRGAPRYAYREQLIRCCSLHTSIGAPRMAEREREGNVQSAKAKRAAVPYGTDESYGASSPV